MKLLTFEDQGLHKLGVQTEQGIIDVDSYGEKANHADVKTDIMSVIAGDKEEVSKLQSILLIKQLVNNTAEFVDRNYYLGTECN